ncbi:MAG: lipopolysaccharide heptosyltransferase family protein, partial [Proteobacteria bacterium]|nr:lipopolysaccharide heptosyltransferase family protein [Pseudomonadota bacterium]
MSQDSIEDDLARLPYLRALRHAFPTGQLAWFAGQGPSSFRGALLPLAQGLIDRVIDTVPLAGRLGDLLARPLAGEQFDLVIDGQRRLLTALALKRIHSRHFLSGSADFFLSERKPAQRLPASASDVARLLQLIELASGTPARPAAPLALTQDARAAARALLPRGPTYVGLAPGAPELSRAWPVNDYVGIARVLAQNGNVPVFFLGPAEQHWHEPIGAAVPTARFPVQHPSVEHLAA